MTKSRNINRPKRKWQPIEDVLLMACYPYSTATALAKALGATKSAVYQRSRNLGLCKSEWFKQSTLSSRLRREDAPGVAYRFPKGHVPANKGKKGISYPGMEATQFKPGQRPGNYRPVGSTRICSKDGYVLIKIEEGMFKWKALHRIVWERMNGAVPPGHVVYFIDGNRLNWKITNLSIMSQRENAIRNSVHRHGKEIAELYYIKGRITRQINKMEGKHG